MDPRTGWTADPSSSPPPRWRCPRTNEGPQWLARVDHYWSEAHRLSWRYIYDSRVDSPSQQFTFPGFITEPEHGIRTSCSRIVTPSRPSYTNEFRFSYGRLHADQSRISPQSVPLAHTLPSHHVITECIATPGVTRASQFRYADNLLFQETQTKLSGRHTFRYGVELLRQLLRRMRSLRREARYRYQSAPGFSAFANFLDDFSGPSGTHPQNSRRRDSLSESFRQSYFFQDTWKTTPSLTLTLGLRYENFGQVANALRYPAFTGFDPERFFEPNQVNPDNKNFGPAFGLAWSPSFIVGLARQAVRRSQDCVAGRLSDQLPGAVYAGYLLGLRYIHAERRV